jgi:hypothetical protein
MRKLGKETAPHRVRRGRMDEIFRPPRGGALPDPESTEHVDPFLARRIETRPWELNSAQWRAWVLAEVAFGKDVTVSLVGRPGHRSFRGLLHLSVPFRDLADHKGRESLFLSWAGQDPVLSRVSMLFVFEPNPVPVS